LESIETLSTLPEGESVRKSTAECLAHPSGRFVYVSNRGHESIAVYRFDADSGKLSRVEIVGTEGQEPRNFYIDPSGKWLLAGNQNSDTVAVFAIDPETGRLRFTGQKVGVGRPVCIRMVR
jgi:6-phosphogluconolactonase